MSQDTLEQLKERLLFLLKREAFKKGEFTLSSGKASSYYLDGRIITLSPEGAYLVASIILEFLKGDDIDAIGGPTLGADPIVGALAVLSHLKKIHLTTFIVRNAAKEHGMQQQIEGPPLSEGSKVILVDDVATTGKSLVEAKKALEETGAVVERAIVIVDRGEGAKENLSQAGLKLEAIFCIEDLKDFKK